MSVHVGPISPEDRHMPRSPNGDLRASFLRLAGTYAAHLFDYAQDLLGDRARSAEAVEGALTEAIHHFGPVELEAAGADGSLRAWLYAVVRRECRDTGSARDDLDGDGFLDQESEQDVERFVTGSSRAQEAVAEVLTAEYMVTELEDEERRRYLEVVTQVLGGLSDEEVEVLSLSVRHGFDVDDLSVALGLSPRRAQAELTAATERFDQLATATLLLYAGWSGCKKLDRLVGGSYPSAPEDRMCRQVARHSKSCATCGQIVASRGFGPEFLSILPIAELPPAVRRWLGSVAPTRDADASLPPELLDLPVPPELSVPRVLPVPPARAEPPERLVSREPLVSPERLVSPEPLVSREPTVSPEPPVSERLAPPESFDRPTAGAQLSPDSPYADLPELPELPELPQDDKPDLPYVDELGLPYADRSRHPYADRPRLPYADRSGHPYAGGPDAEAPYAGRDELPYAGQANSTASDGSPYDEPPHPLAFRQPVLPDLPVLSAMPVSRPEAVGPESEGAESGRPESDSAEFDSAEFDGPEFDGPEFDGPEFGRPESDSPEFEGAESDSAEFDSAEFDAPEFDGPEFDGLARWTAAKPIKPIGSDGAVVAGASGYPSEFDPVRPPALAGSDQPDVPRRSDRHRKPELADAGPIPGHEPWLTRPRAAVLSTLAVVIIAIGAVLASKMSASPDPGHGGSARVTTTHGPSSAPSGTAPSSSAQPTARARPSKSGSASPPAGNLPVTPPPFKPTVEPSLLRPSPKPSSPRPKPSSPKPKPSSPKPTPTTPTPTPTTPTPAPTITLPLGL
jgi:DNA-directed RNA polymerase specialized sigma24 family protein